GQLFNLAFEFPRLIPPPLGCVPRKEPIGAVDMHDGCKLFEWVQMHPFCFFGIIEDPPIKMELLFNRGCESLGLFHIFELEDHTVRCGWLHVRRLLWSLEW